MLEIELVSMVPLFQGQGHLEAHAGHDQDRQMSLKSCGWE